MASDRAPQFFTVPAGKQPKRCDYCPVQLYFIRVPKRGGGTRWVPVHCDPEKVPGAALPTHAVDGRGVNHWTDCTGRDAARRDHPRAPTKSGQATQRELGVAHKAPTCIFCSCTTGKRCTIVKADLSPMELDVQIGRYGKIGRHDLPDVVSCYFVQFDPPVCSAPECQAKRQSELPLRMRAGPRPSEIS